MKSLIIEDDYITSQVMQEILLSFGEADVAENGFKGLELFTTALVDNKKYTLLEIDKNNNFLCRLCICREENITIIDHSTIINHN